MSRTARRRLIVLSISACFTLASFVSMYVLARNARSSEWSEKVQPHDMSERWGIILALSECLDPENDRCRHMPNFIPQSLWDNEACAALVHNTLNFIFGEDVFANANAWTFAKVNEDLMTLVYDRQHDFEIDGDRIKEIKDGGFVLSKLLSRDDVYVIGYHYHDTRSDTKIIAADEYWNSHVMLLLPRKSSGWWGFHLVHMGDENPIRIDRIDEMPKLFDLMYIWRIENIIRPEHVDEVILHHNTLPYKTAVKWLRLSGYAERVSSYIDTIAMWAANSYHGTEQYPRVVLRNNSTPLPVVDPTDSNGCSHNDVLGFFHGEAIRCHSEKSSRGPYGLENQCVEFVNRFLARHLGYKNLTRTGHAYSYYTRAKVKGLRRYPQGGRVKPQPYDLLILRKQDGGFGHVSVVSSVTDTQVCVVQQNTHPKFEPWHTCYRLVSDSNRYRIEGTFLPVLGWSRLPKKFLEQERSDEKGNASSISGSVSGTSYRRRWRLQRRRGWLRLPNDTKPTLVDSIKVSHGDKLLPLVSSHHADLHATLDCNPELHSVHRIYVNQVLTLCK